MIGQSGIHVYYVGNSGVNSGVNSGGEEETIDILFKDNGLGVSPAWTKLDEAG